MNENNIDRRTFVGGVAGAVLAGVPFTSQARQAQAKPASRIRVGVIGCGSGSHSYLPNLGNSPDVELVSACDIIPERAKGQAEAYAIPNQYPHIDLLLAGAPFDLLVNLTDMQEHERLNLQAVAAGKHVWSEKPMANSLSAGERVLAVYNLTTLTGLLGPAKSVVAMTSVITPTRTISGRGEVKVVAEDNAMVLLDHGDGLISHVQSGFNYFNPHGHDGSKEQRHTVTIVGTTGSLGLVGYDWEPLGVDLVTANDPTVTRHATEKEDFVWPMGATLAAESLATEKPLLINPEHALHVLEVIQAARESQDSGRRIHLRSSFSRPIGS